MMRLRARRGTAECAQSRSACAGVQMLTRPSGRGMLELARGVGLDRLRRRLC